MPRVPEIYFDTNAFSNRYRHRAGSPENKPRKLIRAAARNNRIRLVTSVWTIEELGGLAERRWDVYREVTRFVLASTYGLFEDTDMLLDRQLQLGPALTPRERFIPGAAERATGTAAGSRRLRVVYEEVRDQVDAQLQNIEAQDAKAGILTALSGGLFAAMLALALTTDIQQRQHGEITLLVLAAVATTVSVAAALFGLWPRTWHRDPGHDALIREYEAERSKDVDAVLRQLTGNLRGNYAENLRGITAKSRAPYVSFVALVVALTFAVAVALAHAMIW